LIVVEKPMLFFVASCAKGRVGTGSTTDHLVGAKLASIALYWIVARDAGRALILLEEALIAGRLAFDA